MKPHLKNTNMSEVSTKKMTEALSKHIQEYLERIGSDITGLSWFSSIAEHHPKNQKESQ